VASVFDRFFRNAETGDLAIAQWPNLPLAAFLGATALRLAFHPAGAAEAVITVVARVSLAWWSVDEVLRGDSPFRRLLGTVVLVALVVPLLLR